MRRLVIVALTVLIAAACSSGDSSVTSAPATTAPSTTAPETSSSTTASPSTTTLRSPPPEVELPDVDIDDAGEAFVLIMAFIDDLSRNPQPDLLVGYYDPGCPAYGIAVDNFTQLADNSWRWAVSEPTEITRLLPVSQDESGAQIIATYTIATDELYDGDGNLVRTEPEQTFEQGITLTRSGDHGWRICDTLEVIDP